MIKNILRFAITSQLFFLASCSDNETDANAAFVKISTSLTATQSEVDPVAKRGKLVALKKEIDDPATTFPGTQIAVKIASDEKIGPYRPSDLVAEIDQLAHDLAFCKRDVNAACLQERVAKHDATYDETARCQAAGVRIAIALREGRMGDASEMARKLKIKRPILAGNSRNETRRNPQGGDVAAYIVDNPATEKDEFWFCSEEADILRTAFNGPSYQEPLVHGLTETFEAYPFSEERAARLVDLIASNRNEQQFNDRNCHLRRWNSERGRPIQQASKPE